MFAIVLSPNYANPKILKSGTAKITTLDVGQGLAVLIETKHHNLLFDVANKRFQSTSIFKLTIEQFLVNKHINSLDKLIISHPDKDHSGGFNDAIASLQINEILSSTPNKFIGAKNCSPQIWHWDQVEFKMLHPAGKQKMSANNNSCVLSVTTAQDNTMLILADIEARAEKILVDNNPKLTAQVVLVPHHGSKTSSSEFLLQQLQAKIGVISAGYKNRYKHPNASVVKRLIAHKIQILNTAEHGAIEILLNDKIKVTKYRSKYGRFWHHW